MGDLKQAALYFDKVMPVFRDGIECKTSITQSTTSTKIRFKSNLDSKILANLILGPDTKEIKLDPTLASNVTQGMDMALEGFIIRECNTHEIKSLEENITECYFRNIEVTHPSPPRIHDFRGFLKYWSNNFGVTNPAILLSQNFKNIRSGRDIEGEDMVVKLIAANLVDVKNLEWEQIYELRRDKNSRTKLRNLRLFLYECYSNKSAIFAEDDIHRRLEGYEDACKRHGLETIVSVLTETLSATNVISLLGTGFAASIFGGAIAGISSATVLEIGKIALTIAKRKSSMSKLKDNHELSYCISILEKAKKSK